MLYFDYQFLKSNYHQYYIFFYTIYTGKKYHGFMQLHLIPTSLLYSFSFTGISDLNKSFRIAIIRITIWIFHFVTHELVVNQVAKLVLITSSIILFSFFTINLLITQYNSISYSSNTSTGSVFHIILSLCSPHFSYRVTNLYTLLRLYLKRH